MIADLWPTEDIDEVIAARPTLGTDAPPDPAPPPKRARDDGLVVRTWADLMAEPMEPPPVIRPGLPTVGCTVLAGAPKAGKTLWATQTALESRVPFLLIVEEGSLAGVGYRLRRQAEALGIADPPLSLLYRQRIRLDEPRSVERLRELVADHPAKLVILDPLNRLHGADENRPSLMTPVMDALAGIAYDFGRAVLAIHHLAKPSAERKGDIWDRFRGAGSIRSGTDANLILENGRLVGELRDAEPLTEYVELDRDRLVFTTLDAPKAPVKVDPIALRRFVVEKQTVTADEVAERFEVSRMTAFTSLRALGCDEFRGARNRITFSLATLS